MSIGKDGIDKAISEKPCLILTVGLPRSGKSSWARNQDIPIVNPDAIRLALHGQAFIASAEPIVWATARLMVSALFRTGHCTVILDACNGTQKRRDEWKSDDWQLSFRSFCTPKGICIERALQDGKTDLVPVIERMASQFEPIDEYE